MGSKTITWEDPAATAAEGLKLNGHDYLTAVMEGRLPPPPMARLLGFQMTEIGDGVAAFTVTPDESTYNPIGMVHGGLLCTLLDSVAGCALHTRLEAGVAYSSIEIKVNFLKAIHAKTGTIEARGRVVRAGRRVGFAEAEAYSGDQIVGSASTSLLITRP
jgi:uncharacterized protein (TIGR00369 family)